MSEAHSVPPGYNGTTESMACNQLKGTVIKDVLGDLRQISYMTV